jgi:hypothetical protein
VFGIAIGERFQPSASASIDAPLTQTPIQIGQNRAMEVDEGAAIFGEEKIVLWGGRNRETL